MPALSAPAPLWQGCVAQASANGATPAGGVGVLQAPAAQDTAGLVFSPGEPGAWDDACVGNPVVRAGSFLTGLSFPVSLLLAARDRSVGCAVLSALVPLRARGAPRLCPSFGRAGAREGVCRRPAQRCCSLERARRGPPGRPERSRLAQVRCYVGDNEERWFMWYSGRSAGCPGLDATTPAAGSIGAPLCGSGRLRQPLCRVVRV
jgi:hypothetical protein